MTWKYRLRQDSLIGFTKPSAHLSRLHCVKTYAESIQRYELRVCTNKTCKSQGSVQIAQFGKDLNLPEVLVTTCGCLGNCGSGPNAALLPTTADASSPPIIINHITTPARLVDIISTACQVEIDDNILKATELRLAGNAAAREGQLQLAVDLFTQGIELNPSRGKHLLLSNRSGTRLALEDAQGALDDAEQAVKVAPLDFTTAAVRQADALFALGRYKDSLDALDAGAQRHPPFAKTSDYKTLRGAIEKAVLQKKR